MEQVNRLPEWAKQLATIANEHSDFGDREGRLVDAVVEAPHTEGLLGMWVPRSTGSVEPDRVSALEVMKDLSCGDPLCVRQNPLTRLSIAHVTRAARDVATFVYNAAGTTAPRAGAARQRGPT